MTLREQQHPVVTYPSADRVPPPAAPILQHAVGFDQRRGLFGELGDSVNDAATDARHEARSRDILLGDLVDRDPASPAVSGLAMAWYRVANRTRNVIPTTGP